MNQAIIRPIISEKSMFDAKSGKFTFVFAKSARKEHIKKEIEKAFNVHVTGVMTSVVKGGRKRIGKRKEEVQVSSWKKATVILEKGEKISLFDIAEEK